MFGSDVLVASIVELDAQASKVYLPGDTTWTDAWTEQVYPGGQWLTVEALGAHPIVLA